MMMDPDCRPLLDVDALTLAISDCPDHSLVKLYNFMVDGDLSRDETIKALGG